MPVRSMHASPGAQRGPRRRPRSGADDPHVAAANSPRRAALALRAGAAPAAGPHAVLVRTDTSCPVSHSGEPSVAGRPGCFTRPHQVAERDAVGETAKCLQLEHAGGLGDARALGVQRKAGTRLHLLEADAGMNAVQIDPAATLHRSQHRERSDDHLDSSAVGAQPLGTEKVHRLHEGARAIPEWRIRPSPCSSTVSTPSGSRRPSAPRRPSPVR